MAGAARGRGGANAAEKAARIGASRAGGRPAPGGPANAPRAAWPVRSLRNAFFDHRGRRASVRSSNAGKKRSYASAPKAASAAFGFVQAIDDFDFWPIARHNQQLCNPVPTLDPICIISMIEEKNL